MHINISLLLLLLSDIYIHTYFVVSGLADVVEALSDLQENVCEVMHEQDRRPDPGEAGQVGQQDERYRHQVVENHLERV